MTCGHNCKMCTSRCLELLYDLTGSWKNCFVMEIGMTERGINSRSNFLQTLYVRWTRVGWVKCSLELKSPVDWVITSCPAGLRSKIANDLHSTMFSESHKGVNKREWIDSPTWPGTSRRIFSQSRHSQRWELDILDRPMMDYACVVLVCKCVH